jgi:hypothetical protein
MRRRPTETRSKTRLPNHGPAGGFSVQPYTNRRGCFTQRTRRTLRKGLLQLPFWPLWTAREMFRPGGRNHNSCPLRILYIMRTTLTTLLCLLAINFYEPVQAAPTDLEIHCVRKKTDTDGNQTTRAGHVTRTKEHWAYDVTVENKTFKELSGLEMKYVIFFKEEKLAKHDAAASRRESGSLTIGSLGHTRDFFP